MNEYEVVESARWGEDRPDVWYDCIDSATAGQWEPILELRSRLAGVQTAAGLARRELDGLIASALGEGGAIHDGETFYRSTTDGGLKVHDPDGLMRWLADDAGMAFNPNTARVGSVRMIAEGRGENPHAVIDTFYDRPSKDKPALQARPLSHKSTPAYAAKLEPYEQKGGG